jgi:FMN phosphatase YigB (HAD superfamily)
VRRDPNPPRVARSAPDVSIPRIRAAVFDLGGVMCRFLPERRLAALASACGRGEREVHARLWDSGFSQDCDCGRYTAAEAYAVAREALGLEWGYERFSELWALAFEPTEGVLTLVAASRARTLTALLTDDGPVLLDALPVFLPSVTRCCDRVCFSCQFGALKPAPSLFARVVEKLGFPSRAILFIDDAPRNVAGARACGIEALRFRSPDKLLRDLKPRGLVS